jgi:hypothetical protein
MNVISAGSLYVTLLLWVVVAIAIAVSLSYFFRPRTRRLYPGGNRRYLLALTVQASGFILPIPFVLIMLLGRPIMPGLDVIIAVGVGVAVVFALRALPVTGPLLKDLHRARVEAVMERLGPRPDANADGGQR